MSGPMDKSNHDDDSCSTASFEDVAGESGRQGDKPDGEAKGLELVRRKGADKAEEQDEDVPDVLYVVQFYDEHGRLINTRKSDKPVDLSKDKASEENKKKPVIEIVTNVSASPKRGGPRGVPPVYVHTPHRPGRMVHPPYRRGSFSDSDDGGDDLNIGGAERSEMVIHSQPLKQALGSVVGYYPGEGFIGGERVIIEAPYRVLVHHRAALERYRSAQPASHGPEQAAETARHIDVLLGYLDGLYGARIREEEERHRREPAAATFDWFWLLFRPGEVLYYRSRDVWTPYVISRLDYLRGSDGQARFEIDCWNLRYSDGRVRRNMRKVTTRFFAGEQAIRDLPAIPAAFFPADLAQLAADPKAGTTSPYASAAAKQIALGRTYWELVQRPAYKEYDGKLVDRSDDNDDEGGLSGQLKGRVIVDAEGWDRFQSRGPRSVRGPPGHRRHMQPPQPPPHRDVLPYFSPRCTCAECMRQHHHHLGSARGMGPFANFEDLDPTKDTPPENELYFLVLAKDIPAFVLGERSWGHIVVEKLREVRPDREAFKHLVLDDEVKTTVKSLIGKFASTDGKVTPWPRDLIKNKGEGRIFLLHGSPGVGKTATCEAAAELGHRPLLCLTSGDIGSYDVESNLSYFLQLGERYGALVLLDEADVYLEKRSSQDLARNGLVSVFLRALEYFKGVLFLTTNRVEAFDSAFTSRIHVALHYRRLTDDDRRRVWENLFDRLERDSGGRIYVGMSTREFVHASVDVRGLRLNGRQIKNALQVAVALAEAEAVEDGVVEGFESLGGVEGVEGADAADAESQAGGNRALVAARAIVTERHIRSVVKMNKGFKDYMSRRRNWTEDEVEDSDDEEEHDADQGNGSDED